MPLIKYKKTAFTRRSRALIAQANEIILEFAEKGYDLTLRQLYYQFVSRNIIPNTKAEYGKLGKLLGNARLAGLVDWHSIVDRTREVKHNNHWENEVDLLEWAAKGFGIDLWEDQEYHVEVWIEKDALRGVIKPVCEELDVNYFSCRGFTSLTEVWGAAGRLMRHQRAHKTVDGRKVDKQPQKCVIIHLGDHDPSGIDMTRDIRERLELFCITHGYDAPQILRIALNWDQIEQYGPPPNYAKSTDSRYQGYVDKFGEESWELDALSPETIDGLIRDAVAQYRDDKVFATRKEKQEGERELVQAVSNNWDELKEYMVDQGYLEERDE